MVKLLLYLSSHKDIWGHRGKDPCILNIGTLWSGQVQTLLFFPQKNSQYTLAHWIWGWVGPIAALDIRQREKSHLSHSVHSQSLSYILSHNLNYETQAKLVLKPTTAGTAKLSWVAVNYEMHVICNGHRMTLLGGELK